jgi:undecaprenyl pyrophosphate phosphatase UppP
MTHILRRRFWIETFLASATGVVAIVTFLWHDWIEVVFGTDPDKGSGSTEWLVVVVLMIVTVTLGIAARLEWRRARLVQR